MLLALLSYALVLLLSTLLMLLYALLLNQLQMLSLLFDLGLGLLEGDLATLQQL